VAFKARCTLAWQAAQVMPSTGSVTFVGVVVSTVGVFMSSPTSQ
jgi:hypothetical protein